MIKLLELAKTPSIFGKQTILETFTEMERSVVWFTLNHAFEYGDACVVPDFAHVGEPTLELLSMLEATLSGSKPLHKPLTHDVITKFCESDPSKELLRLVLSRTLNCGVNSILVERVFGGSFLPTFAVQLASSKYKPPRVYPQLVQKKENGVRIIATCVGDRVSLRTREGNYILCKELQEQLRKLELNHTLDGELVLGEGLAEDRPVLSGKVLSAMHGTNLVLDNIIFSVFDCLTTYEWGTQICTTSYEDRLTKLATMDLSSTPNIKLTSTDLVNNETEILTLFADYARNGGEGVVIKHPKHLYKFSRTVDWVKLKVVKDCELLCIGTEPGKGKYFGLIGKLICEGTLEGKKIQVKVGSGFTDEERNMPPETYIGESINISYGSISSNKKGQYSLEWPRYNFIRYEAV